MGYQGRYPTQKSLGATGTNPKPSETNWLIILQNPLYQQPCCNRMWATEQHRLHLFSTELCNGSCEYLWNQCQTLSNCKVFKWDSHIQFIKGNHTWMQIMTMNLTGALVWLKYDHSHGGRIDCSGWSYPLYIICRSYRNYIWYIIIYVVNIYYILYYRLCNHSVLRAFQIFVVFFVLCQDQIQWATRYHCYSKTKHLFRWYPVNSKKQLIINKKACVSWKGEIAPNGSLE